jgi:putative copper resistance protein D
MRRQRRRAAAFAALGVLAGALAALPTLSVRAYPGTYWTPTVPYQAVSVARGREVYGHHCVSCHGAAGRGDGPMAPQLPKPPANLTEPHTADHTAGDFFWWLTYGIEESGMPPFADVIEPDERWDLVNYLRAFASGYQARVLGPRISPEKPWLAAVDFHYGTAEGERGLLREYRERSVVLLVFFTRSASGERLRRLSAMYQEIRGAGAEILAVPLEAEAPRPEEIPLPIAVEGTAEIAVTYSLFRRTFSDPGNDQDDDVPGHLELLVDRYGYVRARWRPDVDRDGWDRDELLLEQIRTLAAEPKILPPPDDHVH